MGEFYNDYFILVCEVEDLTSNTRTKFVPIDAITEVYIKPDGNDSISISDKIYICKDGNFNIQELRGFNYTKATEPQETEATEWNELTTP